MSRKHFFSSSEGMVVHMLQSLVARHQHLALDEQHRVMYNLAYSSSQVALVSGGGSGHEPAWSGFVGDGMLTAAVCGDIFASPSTKQIMAGVGRVPSKEGILLCAGNYTGDMLHFGLAREKLQAMGHKVDLVCMADDVALGRDRTGNVGRRGLAGNLLVIKLTGAASQRGWSFERCRKIAQSGNSQLVTIGTSLDHCHVPGRDAFESVPDDTCVLGMGIHNEPGFRMISPVPSSEDLVNEMLRYMLDPSDKDRAFVQFSPSDTVVLLMNNFGGLSGLEFDALVHVSLEVLKRNWDIEPARVYSGIMQGSLNGLGFSITLSNMSGIAKATDLRVEEILSLLDAPTTAPAWPKNGYLPVHSNIEREGLGEKSSFAVKDNLVQDNGHVTPAALIHALRKACNAGIEAEPEITLFDLKMGDGDCGESIAGVCKSILTNINKMGTNVPPVFALLESIGEKFEDVGGSIGAILSILVTAFTNALSVEVLKANRLLDMTVVAVSASAALEILKKYTSAREGDRTIMDVLIPFISTLLETKDLSRAVDIAETKAAATKDMKPRFGRAALIGDDDEDDERSKIPDPGAYAASVWLRGLESGLNEMREKS